MKPRTNRMWMTAVAVGWLLLFGHVESSSAAPQAPAPTEEEMVLALESAGVGAARWAASDSSLLQLADAKSRKAKRLAKRAAKKAKRAARKAKRKARREKAADS